MKCLLICQVRTTILVTSSRSLRVWGSMYRLISMPLTSLPWVINGFESRGTKCRHFLNQFLQAESRLC